MRVNVDTFGIVRRADLKARVNTPEQVLGLYSYWDNVFASTVSNWLDYLIRK